ncbi:hypothetical protein Tco_1029193 [Tanacetum coccineum]|uniref:Uncharacterized protein n=1 Tax=Tanacetum coccineum TaxID=301880 RepID=A0ABQ5G4Z1_9ASTR
MTLRDPNIYVSDLSFSGGGNSEGSAAANSVMHVSADGDCGKQTHQSQMPLYSQLEGTRSSVGTAEGSAEARMVSRILLRVLLILFRIGVSNVAWDGHRSRISQRVDMDSQRVDLLMGDRMTLQKTVWMVEDEAYTSREAWAHSIGLSQATHQELQTYRDHVYAHETHLQAHQTHLQLQSTLIQTQHQMVETLRVIRDMRREMSDMQAELLALREQQRRARQPGPEARILDHQDASGDADSHNTSDLCYYLARSLCRHVKD